jgi:hypothetical protein
VRGSTPGVGMTKDQATYLSFDLDVTNGGKFYVWLLGYGPDDSADSFTVQFDKGTTKATRWLEIVRDCLKSSRARGLGAAGPRKNPFRLALPRRSRGRARRKTDP